MWFVLTSDHCKMPKQEQKGLKMSEMAIFDVFCLLTQKLIFFHLILKLFLESTGPIRPRKVNFEVFATAKRTLWEVQRRVSDESINMYKEIVERS